MGMDDGNKPFCTGMAMVMDMSGFHWPQGNPLQCLILFLPSLKLDTEERFLYGVIAVAALGVFCELVSALRTRIVSIRQGTLRTGSGRILVTCISSCCCTSGIGGALTLATLFALNIASSYILMLAAMSYRVELLAGAVGGLAIGHVLFSSAMEEVPKQNADEGEKSDIEAPPLPSSMKKSASTSASASTRATPAAKEANEKAKGASASTTKIAAKSPTKSPVKTPINEPIKGGRSSFSKPIGAST